MKKINLLCVSILAFQTLSSNITVFAETTIQNRESEGVLDQSSVPTPKSEQDLQQDIVLENDDISNIDMLPTESKLLGENIKTDKGSTEVNQEVMTSIDAPQETLLKEGTSRANIASGIWGTSNWYINDLGELHIEAGTWENLSGTPDWKTYASSVTSIIFDGNVVATGKINNYFSQLPKLVTVQNASQLDISKVTSIDNLFTGCTLLQSVDVSQWDISSIKFMTSVFERCSSLKAIDVSNWDTSQIQSIRVVFKNCTSLQNIDVSKWDTANLVAIDELFFGCSSLQKLDVSNWNTAKIESLASAFRACNLLKELDVSNWNTPNLTNVSNAFRDSVSLLSLDLSNWDMTKIKYDSAIFKGTTSLWKLKLSAKSKFVNGGLDPNTLQIDNAPNNSMYTGFWQNIGNGTDTSPKGTNIWNAAQFVQNYNGAVNADTYVWQPRVRVAANVTAKYVDETGNPITAEVVFTGNIGETYQSEQKDITGYTFKEIQGNATGNFTNQEQTVTYVYTKNPVKGANVTAKYVDETGNPITAEVVFTGNIGEAYQSEQKNITGYTFKEIQGNATGNFTNQEQTVTYVYTKNSVSIIDDVVKPKVPLTDAASIDVPTDSSKLPNTGERSSNQAIIGGLLLIIIAGGFVFFRKRGQHRDS